MHCCHRRRVKRVSSDSNEVSSSAHHGDKNGKSNVNRSVLCLIPSRCARLAEVDAKMCCRFPRCLHLPLSPTSAPSLCFVNEKREWCKKQAASFKRAHAAAPDTVHERRFSIPSHRYVLHRQQHYEAPASALVRSVTPPSSTHLSFKRSIGTFPSHTHDGK